VKENEQIELISNQETGNLIEILGNNMDYDENLVKICS